MTPLITRRLSTGQHIVALLNQTGYCMLLHFTDLHRGQITMQVFLEARKSDSVSLHYVQDGSYKSRPNHLTLIRGRDTRRKGWQRTGSFSSLFQGKVGSSSSLFQGKASGIVERFAANLSLPREPASLLLYCRKFGLLHLEHVKISQGPVVCFSGNLFRGV